MPGKSPGAAAVRGNGQDGLILLHDLGNSLVAVAFGLERLRGRQRTEELETLVERTLEQAAQGIAAMRTLLQDSDRSRAPYNDPRA